MGRRIAAILTLLPSIAFASDTTKVTEIAGPVKVKRFYNVPSDRVLVLKGPVRKENMTALSKQLRDVASRGTSAPAYLDINSPGGSVIAGIEFIQTMTDLKEHRGLKTICIVRSAAYSMAAVIAMYCHETYMLTLSDIMFHGASYGVGGNAKDVLAQVLHITRWLAEMETELAAQMGLTYKDFQRIRGRELWLTAYQAAQFGFVDGLSPSFYHEALPPGTDERFFELEVEEIKGDIQYKIDKNAQMCYR